MENKKNQLPKNSSAKESKQESDWQQYVRGQNFPLDFFVSQKAWQKFELPKILQQLKQIPQGKEIARSRILVHQINQYTKPHLALAPAEFTAIGLINEIFHYLTNYYVEDLDDQVFKTIAKQYQKKNSKEQSQQTIEKFVSHFYPLNFLNESAQPQKDIKEISNDPDLILTFLAETIYVDLFNENPAATRYRIVYDNQELQEDQSYQKLKKTMQEQFEKSAGIGRDKKNFLQFLQEPQQADPISVYGQLDYIYTYWAYLLPNYLLSKILRSLDFLKEENTGRSFAGIGERDTFTPNYSDADLFPEYEAFTSDRDWMPNVILLAKNAYVWLYQLSQKYAIEIKTLDQIPDQELDILSQRGFTALWLIGLWQRSPSSSRIKHLCGNPDAIASAYSIFEYSIDELLGGEAAIENLSQRCRLRGIRLASDMVPNHMGVFSKWMVEHPEYFLAVDHCPFPGYQFNGENLSPNKDIGIYIEDGYYNRSDAAVVFKRVDFQTGETKYIYHGNDGTAMPWNDTAQLDYLKGEVREAVMQEIFRVAKNFSIIRFDAAMTLTKKHIQRLWFPLPGQGGDIPTRSEFSMSSEEFHAALPNEFWREVVDRMATDAPDTLLLAEAFWLLEGFFVRTLGMHRVYNSAFMNMLYKEENSKYRYLIRETLEFEPEILKRYTNFMTNPDEETALEQFGSGDRYFGTALMMVTLPGLPMWGHGQVENFKEKYGMEYAKAYYNEEEDLAFIDHHKRVLFPLMHKRYIFSGVENFQLFNFDHQDGYVDENVFAYSNREETEKSLVIFNNRYSDTAGSIRVSVGKLNKETNELQQVVLTDALMLHREKEYFTIMFDQMNGLEYIRSNIQLHQEGLFVMLKPHQSHAFINIREVYDADGHWQKIFQDLNGSGVSSIEEFYRETRYQEIILLLEQIINFEDSQKFLKILLEEKTFSVTSPLKEKMEKTIFSLVETLQPNRKQSENKKLGQDLARRVLKNLQISHNLLQKEKLENKKKEERKQKALFLIYVSLLADLGTIRSPQNSQMQSARWFDEWVLYKRCSRIFEKHQVENIFGFSLTHLLHLGIRHKDWGSFFENEREAEWLHSFFAHHDVQSFVRLHKYASKVYVQKEQLEILFAYLSFLLKLHSENVVVINKANQFLTKVLEQTEQCGYVFSCVLEKFSINKEMSSTLDSTTEGTKSHSNKKKSTIKKEKKPNSKNT